MEIVSLQKLSDDSLISEREVSEKNAFTRADNILEKWEEVKKQSVAKIYNVIENSFTPVMNPIKKKLYVYDNKLCSGNTQTSRGDGNCLLHSMRAALGKPYSVLEAAQDRFHIYCMLHERDAHILYGFLDSKMEFLKQNLINRYSWLDTEYLSLLSHYYKVNILVTAVSFEDKDRLMVSFPSLVNKTYPIAIIYNNSQGKIDTKHQTTSVVDEGSHFEPFIYIDKVEKSLIPAYSGLGIYIWNILGSLSLY